MGSMGPIWLPGQSFTHGTFIDFPRYPGRVWFFGVLVLDDKKGPRGTLAVTNAKYRAHSDYT